MSASTTTPGTGRAAGRPLAPGTYRAVLTPTAGRAVGSTRTVALTVLRPAR